MASRTETRILIYICANFRWQAMVRTYRLAIATLAPRGGLTDRSTAQPQHRRPLAKQSLIQFFARAPAREVG